MKDSTVLGAMFDMPLLFQTGKFIKSARLIVGYNRFGNMTDIPYGTLINFPIPGPYAAALPPVRDRHRQPGRHGPVGPHLGAQASATPSPTSSAAATSRAIPTARSASTGSAASWAIPTTARAATAYYAGLRWTPTPKVDLGLEFNHGSPRWFTYTPSSGELGDKLAARGDVWEGYARCNFAKTRFLRVGYIYYDYSTAFSGWHIAPANLDYYDLDNNAVNFYAFPKTVKNAYFLFDAKW